MNSKNVCFWLVLQLTIGICFAIENEGKLREKRAILSCDNVRCGYGASCQIKNGRPVCRCPVQVCAQIYDPVCGTDGKTYSNSCNLQSATCKSNGAIVKAKDGECEGSNDKPLNDENGDKNNDHDYPESDGGKDNHNQVKGDKDNSENEKKCKNNPRSIQEEESGCNKVCTKEFKPVCGSDGVTYSNLCLLEVASCRGIIAIDKVSDGPCPGADKPIPNWSPKCRFVCPRARYPRCSQQQLQTGNTRFCLSHQVIPTIVKCGCRPGNSSNQCPDVCITLFKPVCGSNGKTYSNECELNRASCRSPVPITKISDGTCSNPVFTHPIADEES